MGGGNLTWGCSGGGETVTNGQALRKLLPSQAPQSTANNSTSTSTPPPVAAALTSASNRAGKYWWLIALAIGLALIILWSVLNFS
jgi:uncharacterized protein HemX